MASHGGPLFRRKGNKIMKLRTLLVASLLPLPLSMMACAASDGIDGSDAEEDSVQEVDAELSASGIQILGAITQGQTLKTAYTRTPKYRAYTFTAARGDVVDFWVRGIDGGDAYAYILRPSFSTLKSNNDAPGNGKDAHVRATISTAGTYYIVFRDAASRAGTFNVSFTKPEAPVVDGGPGPDAGPQVPSCNDAPRFPTTGPLAATSVTLYTSERDCDAFGVCTPWKITNQRGVSGSTTYGVTSVDQNRRAKVEIKLSSYSSQQGSSLYYCTTTDRDASWSTQLDANGQGTTSMVWEDRCNIAGGSGGPRDARTPRPVKISYGSSCMSVTENDPANAYGHQVKQAYIAKF